MMILERWPFYVSFTQHVELYFYLRTNYGDVKEFDKHQPVVVSGVLSNVSKMAALANVR